MGSSAGGVFLPNDPPPMTGAVLTTPTITGATFVGGTISGTTISGGTQTSTGSTFTAPAINGAATIASGATITTPTLAYTAQALTATGTGSGDAAALSAIYPVVCSVTGATGSGVALPAAAAVPGASYQIYNLAAAAMRIYSSGATINGTTGTTAFVLTNTGNKWVSVSCAVAGAWLAAGNT